MAVSITAKLMYFDCQPSLSSLEPLLLFQVHRRDYEEGGVVIDPLKATHTVHVGF
jgi:hypothetical protein